MCTIEQAMEHVMLFHVSFKRIIQPILKENTLKNEIHKTEMSHKNKDQASISRLVSPIQKQVTHTSSTWDKMHAPYN